MPVITKVRDDVELHLNVDVTEARKIVVGDNLCMRVRIYCLEVGAVSAWYGRLLCELLTLGTYTQ